MKEKLPFKLQFSYALGQLGWSILAGIIATYVVFYYIPAKETNIPIFIPQVAIFGVLSIIGIISMFGRLFDAITDPLIATLSDRSQSKDGRRISFMKKSAIPFALFTVLVFMNPVPDLSIINAITLAITLILFYLFMTMYCIPYTALLPELGHNPKERLNLATFISFTWFFGFVIAQTAPVIWTIFIEMGLEKPLSMKITFAILAIIGLIFLYIPVFTIDEKRYCESVASSINMIDSIKMTFENKQFRIFLFSDFAYWVAITILQTSMIFYITSLLDYEESVNTYVMGGLLVASLLFYLPVNLIASKIGKKKLLIIAFGLFMIVFSFSYFLGMLEIPKIAQVGILILIASMPMATFGILPNAVISDLAEYSAKKTGIRREAMFFGMRTFVLKLGQMVAMLIVPSLLLIEQDFLGVRLTTIAAAIFCFIGLVIFIFYNEKKILKGLKSEGEDVSKI